MIKIIALVLNFAISLSAAAADLSAITNADAANGLKQALTDGSAIAVAKLGVENGFLSNPQVKIPLPPALQRVESALRFAGLRKQADDLVVAMNRAAEAAVPEAKALLIDSVRRMTIQDAADVIAYMRSLH